MATRRMLRPRPRWRRACRAASPTGRAGSGRARQRRRSGYDPPQQSHLRCAPATRLARRATQPSPRRCGRAARRPVAHMGRPIALVPCTRREGASATATSAGFWRRSASPGMMSANWSGRYPDLGKFARPTHQFAIYVMLSCLRRVQPSGCRGTRGQESSAPRSLVGAPRTL